MQVWAVANQKGGVGKTTTVVSLGGLLSMQGYKTLMIDMDPHGSMSSYFGFNPDNISQSLYQLFQAKQHSLVVPMASLICSTRFKNLSLLPASTALATLDRQLGKFEGKGLVVRNSLVSMKARYDYLLIDCPPQLGVLMINALAACHHLIIPVQTEFLALKGLERMTHTLMMINRANDTDKCLQYTILPTMYDCRTKASVKTLKALVNDYQDKLWDSVIPVDTQFRDASRAGSPLPISSPRGKGSIAYKGFLDYLLNVDNRQFSSIAS